MSSATIYSQLRIDLQECMRTMTDWTPDLATSDKPRYLAIADAIADRYRRRPAGGRRPAAAAAQAREAARHRFHDGGARLCRSAEARPDRIPGGAGHLRRDKPRRAAAQPAPPPRSGRPVDEPAAGTRRSGTDRAHAGRRRRRRRAISSRCCATRDSAARQADKDAASSWLGRRALVPAQERIFVTPGAHPALLGILSILAKPGETMLCEAITYPGIRSIAAQLGFKLVGLPMDARRHRPRCLDRRLQEREAEGALPQSDPAEPDDADDPRSAPRGDIAAVARRIRPADHRGRRLRLHPDARAARRSRRSRPTSPGMSPASPNASGRACAPPMSWCPTPGRAGRSRRPCAPRPSWRRR